MNMPQSKGTRTTQTKDVEGAAHKSAKGNVNQKSRSKCLLNPQNSSPPYTAVYSKWISAATTDFLLHFCEFMLRYYLILRL